MNPFSERRQIQVVKPLLQLRVVGVFVVLAAVIFFVQLGLLALDLRAFARTVPAGDELVAEVPALLTRSAMFLAGVGLPVMIAVGLWVTHRLAGPAYRMERHLEKVIDGEATGPCQLRKRDAYQELCHLINEAIAELERNREAHEDEGPTDPAPYRRVS